MVWHRALVPVLEPCACHCRARRDLSLVMASAEAFTLLKLAGAVCLIWIGFKTWNEADIVDPIGVEIAGVGGVFRQGIIVEALNPKWAGFFFAFTPQFIELPPMSPGSPSSLGDRCSCAQCCCRCGRDPFAATA